MTPVGRTLFDGTVITAAVSEEEIMAKASPKSIASGNLAWKAKQLAEWGVPWPPPAGWKDALIANFNDKVADLHEPGGAPVAVSSAEPVFHPMLPPHIDNPPRDFSTMDPILKARWIEIISAATCRDEAVALLCVPRRVMNEFAEQVMPDHKWPDSRPPEERRAAYYERREKRRERLNQTGEG